jgi:hypothetical protein
MPPHKRSAERLGIIAIIPITLPAVAKPVFLTFACLHAKMIASTERSTPNNGTKNRAKPMRDKTKAAVPSPSVTGTGDSDSNSLRFCTGARTYPEFCV